MKPEPLTAALRRFPTVPLLAGPTPVEPLSRLAAGLGRSPRILIKRDDAIPFGFGGNKVRKLEFVVGAARAEGADTLITAGGVQSNHARATAAAAARLGFAAVLVANGTRPDRLTGNALLDDLLGARVLYVESRADRTPAMQQVADRLRAEGRRPYAIPIGASTPLGALGFVAAVVELAGQIAAPDVIVHSTSSGGTQAGLVAGCRLLGWKTRVIGISADDPAAALSAQVDLLVRGIGELLGVPEEVALGTAIDVDDAFVGDGYGIPTAASRDAIALLARTEAQFLDPTYTSKAMAGLMAYVRDGRLTPDQTVLFWHTGGQAGLFA